jgi:dinuclear metal center YbgI/SA1388 family protein
MKIADLIACVEEAAPAAYQENYDNSGLIVGNPEAECSGVLVSLDVTEAVVEEAVQKRLNLVFAHHPLVFNGLKRITGKNDGGRALISAIKQDIAIAAAHTNLDNVLDGVNGRMADRLGLTERSVLLPRSHPMEKLFVFVPVDHADALRDALFEAGAGHIGAYSECSFSSEGVGTFKGDPDTHPFAGQPGIRHLEREARLEVIFPATRRQAIVSAMFSHHPYEEVAYDLVSLANPDPKTGSGLIGQLPEAVAEKDFLRLLKDRFQLEVIRHSPLTGKPVRRVGLCGGSGSFLISKALASRVDWFVSADIKYHQFFEAGDHMVIADLGHYESEQFTVDLLVDLIRRKFPNFAVLKTTVLTNPLRYFL